MRRFDRDLLGRGPSSWAGQPYVCLLLCLAALLLSFPAAAETALLELEANGNSSAGHVRLSWAGGETGTSYELQQANDVAFGKPEVRYQGQQTASVISGLPDGEFYFRVRRLGQDGVPGPWSSVVRFAVTHYKLGFALTLLAIGAVIFVATVCFLIVFSRKVRTND